MEQQDDMAYLKRYVQNHPDNRMAWYLLGKQYMLEDKEAKANYCFLQAGSIYEAYERKRHPLAAEPKQMIEHWNRRRKFRLLAARSAALFVLLLGAVMAAPLIDIGERSGNTEETENSEQAAGPADVETNEPAPASAARVVLVKPTDSKPIGKALGVLLESGGGQMAAYGLAAMLEQDGSWRKWTGRTRLLLSAERPAEAGGGVDINLYDAKACACQPADSGDASAAFGDWSGLQEERWTLASAIGHYRELFGRWPEAYAEMIRPYPNNVLSGVSDTMRDMFPELLKTAQAAAEAAADDSDGNAATAGTANGRNGAAAAESGVPDKPLAIVVDKQTHKLAVVSGDVIVRLYTVGLGGDKTPTGSFYISEKVKNPNGSDDGEFGSRGMPLSGTRYAIHGTNEPDSVGKDESHGCIRMLKEDVEELYDLVPLGTKVDIKSGVLPADAPPAQKRFKLQPAEDETNPATVYRWL